MIYIVGLGPGSEDYILAKSINILNKSDYVIGFYRAIESLSFIENNKVIFKTLNEILDFIKINNQKDISIVASGDPTFFGISEYIKKNYNGQIEIIPGISSFQYLTCKLGKSWGNAYLGSLHGREDKFIDTVNKYELSIWLTDKKNNPAKLCKELVDNNIKCDVIVGENLSYENEVITINKPQKLIDYKFSELNVFVVNVSPGERE